MKLFVLFCLLVPALAMGQTTHYSYDVASDIVAGQVDGVLLSKEISESTTITTRLERWSVTGGSDLTLRLTFVAPLGSAEKTALDGDTTNPCGGIIGGHEPSTEPPAEPIWTPVAIVREAGSPGTDDDVSRGIQVGWLWLDTDTSQIWICTDSTDGAAAWTRLDT